MHEQKHALQLGKDAVFIGLNLHVLAPCGASGIMERLQTNDIGIKQSNRENNPRLFTLDWTMRVFPLVQSQLIVRGRPAYGVHTWKLSLGEGRQSCFLR